MTDIEEPDLTILPCPAWAATLLKHKDKEIERLNSRLIDKMADVHSARMEERKRCAEIARGYDTYSACARAIVKAIEEQDR